jgi:hypothetical protein
MAPSVHIFIGNPCWYHNRTILCWLTSAHECWFYKFYVAIKIYPLRDITKLFWHFEAGATERNSLFQSKDEGLFSKNPPYTRMRNCCAYVILPGHLPGCLPKLSKTDAQTALCLAPFAATKTNTHEKWKWKYMVDKYSKFLPCLKFSDRYMCSDTYDASLLYLTMYNTQRLDAGTKAIASRCVLSNITFRHKSGGSAAGNFSELVTPVRLLGFQKCRGSKTKRLRTLS